MPIEEQKYSKFIAAITREANENREKFIREMELIKQDRLMDARAKAEENYKGRLAKKAAAIHEDCGREVSQKILDVRKQLFEERDKIRTEVFDKVRVMLKEFTKQPDYNEFLKKSADCISGYITSGSIIYARGEDISRVKPLFDGVEIVADDEILLGGIKLKAEGIVYDDTLDTRLEGCGSWFEANSKLEID